MEKEVEEGKVYNFKKRVETLSFLKIFIKKLDLYLVGELDIDPFTTFSLEFSAEYWYLKYHLLRDNRVLLTEDDIVLFEELNINVVFFNLSDLHNFIIGCSDGKWYFKMNKLNETSIGIFETLKLEGYL